MESDQVVNLKNLTLQQNELEVEEVSKGESGSSKSGKIEDSSSKSEEGEDKAVKRRKKAQKAWEEQDPDASIAVHDQTTVAKEKHKKGADYLKSIVYGGMDGIMTSFSVVAAAAGAILGSKVILILGISNLIADGIGMGISDFISGKAEIDYALAEQKREEWEYDNYPKGEMDEMIQIYQDKGMSEEDAILLVAALTKHKKVFIDAMMVEELGVKSPDPSDSPAIDGLITFVSFIIYGLVPLIPFMIGIAVPTNFWVLFGVSCALVGIVMFSLGAFTSIFTILSWYKGGLYMFVVGAIGAVASYLIGWGISSSLGSPVPPICNCTM